MTVRWILTLIAMSIAAVGGAQNWTDSVNIHGFGGWVYGVTDGNEYQFGSDDGSYDSAAFSLNIAANPVDKLAIVAQVGWAEGGFGDDVELDFAFAEWSFSDQVKLRAGKVKQPFGIYTEVFDVGTVRPFLALPSALYGPQGFVAEAYEGVGLAGSFYPGNGWGLRYDLYVGALDTVLDHPLGGIDSATGIVSDVTEIEFFFKDVIGARLIVDTPVNGLSAGLSGYAGDPDESTISNPAVAVLAGQSKDVIGVHVEYLLDAFWLRSEFVTMTVGDADSDAFYLEAAYRFSSGIQLAARYEENEIDFPLDASDPLAPFIGGFFEHDDIALAFNYWFSHALVAKLEYHKVTGNRFAAPSDVLPRLFAGQPVDQDTEAIQLGFQFSF